MSRNPVRPAALLAAGALALSLGAAEPASAWPFGGAAKPAAAPVKADPNAPRKATAEERAAAQKLDPLIRATFWQHELTLDPTDVEAGLGLSEALRALGKYDEAADTADRMTAIAPRNEDALLEAARDHIAAGRGFYSIAPLKAAEVLAPKDWRPASLMGVALEQSQRPQEALVAYNQALKLSPNNPAVLSNLAMFYATRRDPAQAEALLRRAVAQPGATAQERQNLALLLGLQGKLGEAEGLMRQDLPPEEADANLAYFRANAASAASTEAQGSAMGPAMGAGMAQPARPQTPDRTWGSVQRSDAKGG